MNTTPSVAIVTHPDFLRYDFGPSHPLRPERITAGLQLLETAGLWDPASESLTARVAEATELALVHDAAYLQAVEQGGSGRASAGEIASYGFGSLDNPPFPDMHYAAALVAGGAAVAARAVMEGTLEHAFHPAGGLHHALRARASGFCIYNDPAVAAAILSREYGARVLYIDLDCHHGDGVQWLFYDDPRVFSLSFHESGRFLFPGTGELTEVGEGAGRGYSLNLPFTPGTRDPCWQSALEAVLPELARRFRPDIIISNHGCDTHVWDPITHLSLTTASFSFQAALVHRLAHEHADGRWLAVGSGGYDWRRVVPRSWSILWAEMTDRALPRTTVPPDWCSRWLTTAETPRPDRFLDAEGISPESHREQERRAINGGTTTAALELLGSVFGPSFLG